MRTWQVRDVMTVDVATVREGTPYREIVDVLTGRHITAVPVVDGGRRVLGVVSQADLLLKVELLGQPYGRRVFEGRRHRAERAKATATLAVDLMTAPPVTVGPHATVADAARVMGRGRVKRLPVVDHLGRLIGIVTRGDLLRVHLRADDDIAREVRREVLDRVLGVPDGVVDVTVTDGVVALTGQLDRWSTVRLARHLSAQVAGVVEVVDALGYAVDDHPSAALHTELRRHVVGMAAPGSH